MAEFATVGLTDFDRGVVVSLGSELVDITVVEGTEEQVRQHYAISCPGLAEYPDEDNLPQELRAIPHFPDQYVPVFFMYPSDVFQPYILPCIVVRRGDLTPNFERAPWWGYQRKPTSDATQIQVPLPNGDKLTGYNKYVEKWNAIPWDISYEVQVLARLQLDAIPLLNCILKAVRPPWFSVAVYDDQGCKRLYDAGDISVSDVSELADIADRTIGWNISFTVRAELDQEGENIIANGGAPGTPGVITRLPEITYVPILDPRFTVLRGAPGDC